MKKFAFVMVALGLVAGIAFAGDYTPTSAESAITQTGTLTASTVVGSDVTVSAMARLTPTAANWTNGSTNTLAASAYLISGTGQANDYTNTVVLANPTTAGDRVVIVMAAATTNLVQIADSGNVAASGAIILDANDVVELYAPTASLWVEVSQTDN